MRYGLDGILCQSCAAGFHDDGQGGCALNDGFDTSMAIPVRDQKYREAPVTLILEGTGAIQGPEPYEVCFFTGSVDLCLPYGALDRSMLTVLESNITDCWGVKADKVRGQIVLKSRNGFTYVLDDYVFYARYGDDERHAAWGNSIAGGFPVPGSIPYELAGKYSPQAMGFGFISESGTSDITAGYRSLKSYLKIGNDQSLNYSLIWRNNANDPGPHLFHAVRGITVTFNFPAVHGTKLPDIVVPDLMATVDTGAPDLTMRLSSDDPHRQAPYKQFFNDNVPSWYSPQDCQNLVRGVTVQIGFTGTSGQTCSFAFTSALSSVYSADKVYVGDWDSSVPWAVNSHTPVNRINLGNSIYFYCPVFYFDIANDRVWLYCK